MSGVAGDRSVGGDMTYEEWLEYWSSLTDEERDEERRMMDAYVASDDDVRGYSRLDLLFGGNW